MMSRSIRTTLAVTVVLSPACNKAGDTDRGESAEAAPSDPSKVAKSRSPDFVAAQLSRLSAAPLCARSEGASRRIAPFCAATAWADSAAVPLPRGALLGATIWVPESGPLALEEHLRFSVLGVRERDAKVFADITSPRGRSEDTAPREAVARVLSALGRNSDEPILLTPGLARFALGRPEQATFAAAKTAGGWQYQGGSFAELRRLGDQWVAIEVPQKAQPGGIYVSVFTTNKVGGRPDHTRHVTLPVSSPGKSPR